MSKKNPIVLIAIGLVLLAVGGFMQFAGGPPRADATLIQACEATMKQRGADVEMIDKCRETAFATAVTATDAESAARSISQANQSEVKGGFVSMFLLGMGSVLLVGGILLRLKKRGAEGQA